MGFAQENLDATSAPYPTDVTSPSLLVQVRAHDRQAWTRLVDLYSPLVASWCRRAGLEATDADDVLQDVFAAVHQGMAGFRRSRASDTFRGWLRVIARNQIRLHFRRASQRAQAVGGTNALMQFAAVADDPLPSEQQTEASEQSLILRRALEMMRAEFEPVTWQAFWRVAVDGRPAVEVASELNLSAGAVRQAKYKVLRRLRTELDELVEIPS